MISIAFGIHTLSLYTDRIGLYGNMELIFPQKIQSTISYNGSTVTYNLSRSAYQSLWGLSSLLAPCFCISHTDKMLVTISPGIHYTMLVAKAYTSSVTYLIGIGANIQDSIFFSTNGYFMIGADLAYDFLGATIMNGDTKSGTTSDFIINPRIGIGFRFK